MTIGRRALIQMLPLAVAGCTTPLAASGAWTPDRSSRIQRTFIGLDGAEYAVGRQALLNHVEALIGGWNGYEIDERYFLLRRAGEGWETLGARNSGPGEGGRFLDVVPDGRNGAIFAVRHNRSGRLRLESQTGRFVADATVAAALAERPGGGAYVLSLGAGSALYASVDARMRPLAREVIPLEPAAAAAHVPSVRRAAGPGVTPRFELRRDALMAGVLQTTNVEGEPGRARVSHWSGPRPASGKAPDREG